MLVSSVLFGFAALLGSCVAADKDLGSVLSGHKNLTTYYKLIQQYPDILLQLPSDDGITIIAPSDAAFSNIPYTSLNGVWDPENKEKTIPLLQYHFLKGTVYTKDIKSGTTIIKSTLLTGSEYTNVTSGQNILITKGEKDVVLTTSIGTRCSLVFRDIPFSGGLVQVVDNLLIPPASIGKTADAFKLTSFLGALYAANLMPAVSDRKNITVFAPQDKALAAVGGTLKNLNAESLARVMGYHIVTDQILVSSALQNGTKLRTLAKDGSSVEEVVIRQAGNNKYVNSAQIVQPDILLANGILHIISDVLNPDADSVMPNPTIATQPPVFSISTENNVFTSALPCTADCPITTTEDTATATTTTSTRVTSRSSKGAAAAARCTAHVAGAALGMLGVGAGMAWM